MFGHLTLVCCLCVGCFWQGINKKLEGKMPNRIPENAIIAIDVGVAMFSETQKKEIADKPYLIAKFEFMDWVERNWLLPKSQLRLWFISRKFENSAYMSLFLMTGVQARMIGLAFDVEKESWNPRWKTIIPPMPHPPKMRIQRKM